MSYVNSVTVYPSSATITKGKWYYGAYASISSNCPECAEVEWYSNSPAIASVNKTTGYIYGVSTGTTRIYAEATDGSGKKDYITVTVTAPVSVTGVSVCPTSLTMNVGDIDYLCETVYPSNATNQTVTWCSSDDSVAEVNTYSGKVTAKKAGTATITATTVDGGYTASCTVTVIIERVTIRRDGYYNEVIFESSGKVWRCINHDLIFDEDNSNNSILKERSDRNIYTHYSEEYPPMHDTAPKEYTDDEIKLLYAIDPYGVADYVKRYADEEFYNGDGLKSNIAYKDKIFRLLYNRDPEYFTRDLLGNWGRIIEPIDPDDVNWSTIISESETLFEMHPVYDLHTLIEFLSVAIEIIGLVSGIAFPTSKVVKRIVTIAARVLSVGEAVVKNDLASFTAGSVIEKAFEDTNLEWALKLVSSFEDWMGIFNSIIDTPNYTGELVTYCAKHSNYLVFAELENGETRLLNDIYTDISN